MANAAEHSAFNFFAVAAATAIVRDRDGQPVGQASLAMGTAAACLPSLPDLLEPALHPNHRKFFHSFTMAFAMIYGLRRAYKWSPDQDWQRLARTLILVGGAAYLAHLARDSLTTKSLPLV